MSTPLWVTTTRGTSVGTATIEADDDTVTLAAHGLVNGQQVTVANPTGGASGVLVADAPYFVAAATTNTFQLRPSPGGPVMGFTADGGCDVYTTAGLMDAQTIRDGLAGLVTAGNSSNRFISRTGVFPMSTETQHVTTSGMTWTAADMVVAVRHSTGRIYIVPHPSESGAVTAADPSQPRIDALDLQIQDHVLDSSGFARGRLVYTAGVPAGVPVAPAVAANAERITTWTVAAGAGSTGTPTTPQFAVARGGVLPVTDSSQYPTSGGRYKGMMLWDIALGQLLVNTTAGGTWVPIASAAAFGSVRRIATTTRTTNTATFTAETSINTVTAALENGKTYAVTWKTNGSSTVAGDRARFRIREDTVGGTQLDLAHVTCDAATVDYPVILYYEYTAVATGNKTFVGTCVRQAGTGNLAVNANASQPNYLYVNYIRG